MLNYITGNTDILTVLLNVARASQIQALQKKQSITCSWSSYALLNLSNNWDISWLKFFVQPSSLGQYTAWLLMPSFVGLLVFLYGVVTMNGPDNRPA